MDIAVDFGYAELGVRSRQRRFHTPAASMAGGALSFCREGWDSRKRESQNYWAQNISLHAYTPVQEVCSTLQTQLLDIYGGSNNFLVAIID
jgi:hypothetical protein